MKVVDGELQVLDGAFGVSFRPLRDVTDKEAEAFVDALDAFIFGFRAQEVCDAYSAASLARINQAEPHELIPAEYEVESTGEIAPGAVETIYWPNNDTLFRPSGILVDEADRERFAFVFILVGVKTQFPMSQGETLVGAFAEHKFDTCPIGLQISMSVKNITSEPRKFRAKLVGKKLGPGPARKCGRCGIEAPSSGGPGLIPHQCPHGVDCCGTLACVECKKKVAADRAIELAGLASRSMTREEFEALAQPREGRDLDTGETMEALRFQQIFETLPTQQCWCCGAVVERDRTSVTGCVEHECQKTPGCKCVREGVAAVVLPSSNIVFGEGSEIERGASQVCYPGISLMRFDLRSWSSRISPHDRFRIDKFAFLVIDERASVELFEVGVADHRVVCGDIHGGLRSDFDEKLSSKIAGAVLAGDQQVYMIVRNNEPSAVILCVAATGTEETP